MPDIEHILLRTGLPPEEVAGRLADVLGGELAHHDGGRVTVRRPLAGEPAGTVGGYVLANDDDDEGVYGSHDTIYELWLTGPGGEDVLHAEAARIFDDVVAALPWP